MRIDHRLGDLGDFRRLVAAAHERGLRVVLDAVFNHTGEGHWAFRHVHAYGASSPYVNWYSIDSLPIRRDPTPNYATFGDCPYLPKLNHQNPEVREYLFAVAKRWLEEGIDGWRLDVPFELNKDFWREFRTVVKGANPDAYIVGEVWELATEWLQGDLCDGTMNYPLRTAILHFAGGQSTPEQFGADLRVVADATPVWARPGMMNLLGSHDTERLANSLNGDSFAVRVAVALLLTSPGAPLIYYGDEIGLSGGPDPDNRRCMDWDTSRWDTGLLSWHQALLTARRGRAELRGLDDEIVPAPGGLLVRRRGIGASASHLVVNARPEPVELPESILAGGRTDLLSGSVLAAGLEPGTVVVPSRAVVLVTG
jgi:glycosidase